MRSRKKKTRETQELNTSSLPDIVFMILFFFMAIGMFPPPQPRIENDIITSSQGVELEDTNNYIHVRVSTGQIQLGYEVIKLEDLTKLLTKIKDKDVVILHIDDDTPIGFVKGEVLPKILDARKTLVSYEVEEIQDEEVEL